MTKEAWDKLQSKHASASKSNRLQMKNQFLSMKMKNNEMVQDVTDRIEEMANHLLSLNKAVTDEDKALVLTRGVPEHFENVVTALQESDRLDDYDHVTNSLVNAESHKIE